MLLIKEGSRMPTLSEKEIEFGYGHGFIDDWPDHVVEVKDYKGQDRLSISCTQLGNVVTGEYTTTKEKKRVLNEWITFLTENPEQFTELRLGSKVPQELFDAVCEQK